MGSRTLLREMNSRRRDSRSRSIELSRRKQIGRESRTQHRSRSRSRDRSHPSHDKNLRYQQQAQRRSQLDPMRNLQQTVLMGAHRLRKQAPRESLGGTSVVAQGSLLLGSEARNATMSLGGNVGTTARPLTNLELESLFATTTSPATAAALRQGGATASAAAAQLRRTLDARRHGRGSEGYLNGWDADARSEVVTVRRARRDPHPNQQDDKSKRARLAQAALEELPEQVLEKCIEEDACPICQQVMDRGEVVRRLPCAHTFHSDCISRWLHVKLTCPLDGLPVEPSSSASAS